MKLYEIQEHRVHGSNYWIRMSHDQWRELLRVVRSVSFNIQICIESNKQTNKQTYIQLDNFENVRKPYLIYKYLSISTGFISVRLQQHLADKNSFFLFVL